MYSIMFPLLSKNSAWKAPAKPIRVRVRVRVRVRFRVGFTFWAGARVGVRIRVGGGRISTSQPTVHQHTTNAQKTYREWAVDRIMTRHR